MSQPLDEFLKLDRALTPQERRLLFQTVAKKNSGYAAAPGSGPQGETCKSCAHYTHNDWRTARAFRKCALMRAVWTHGPGTDILASSPACSQWAKKIAARRAAKSSRFADRK